MKKNLRFLLALAISWLSGLGALAIEPVDGIYQIGSAQDWAEFCTLHNDGTNQRLNAVLTADITVDGNSMIGINGGGKPYRGTFDGQGHKLIVSYELNEERVAPFRRINGATIKNLIVEGTITTSSKLASGLVGGLWQSGTTIQNCASYVTINDTQSGDATHGGLCGSFEDVNGANVIENCAFFGTINAPNREGCGGLVGWTNQKDNTNIIRNCLVAATLNVKKESNNDVICRNNGVVENCYYIGSIDGLKNDKGGIAATEIQAASGELCFLLNGSQSKTPAWFQTIGTDDMPNVIGTDVVYVTGSLNCDGTPKGDVSYSNTESEPQRDAHQWNDWGFCANCNAMQPDFLTADEEGYYPIATKKDYNWFMMNVNNGNGHSNARLTQDLDLSDYTFVPLGVDGSKFKGIFDGQGHRILNMTIDGTKKEQGFISVASGGTIIKNLIIDSSCQMVGTGGGNVAALIGCVNGNEYGDTIIIENVGNEMSFSVTTTNNAGFVARDFSDYLKLIFNNCYNTGNIMGGVENGAFTAWTPRVTLNNCWNTGRIEKTGGYNGSTSLARGNQPVRNNSYDLNSENTDNAGAPEGYAAEWLTSGKLAFVLNGNSSENVKWYQKLGEEGDAYPMPFGTDIVYANGQLDCAGNAKEGTTVTYSNTDGAVRDEHQFAEGFCTACGTVDVNYIAATDGAYNLASAKDVVWFAALVNSGKGNANANLTADIDFTDVTFTGIGNASNHYTGTFDGKGHIVKNMVIDLPEVANVGFFNEIDNGAVIKNFTIDASCSVKGKAFTGAFVGHVSGSGTALLERLGNEGAVETVNQNAGAIVGCNTSGELKLTVKNCYNAGPIKSDNEAGGLSGWFGNDAITINCYNMGTVTNGESYGRGNNIQITNCFDAVTSWPALNKVDAADFTNGVVYALLAEAAPYVWFLSAEEGGHPVLYKTKWGGKELSPYAGVEVQEGEEFYLYNVESGMWLQENNRFTADWNTHGELGTVGFDVKLIKSGDGWQIDPKFGHNNSMNGNGQYLDTNESVTAWTFVPVDIDGISKTYYIKSGDNYLRAGDNDKLTCNGTAEKNIWQVVTREQRIEYAKTATKASPKDLSFLIRGNEFTHEDTRRQANWTLSDNDNSGEGWNAGRFDGDNRQNSVFEAWDMTKMNLAQTVTGLPAGFYTVEVRASESPTGNGGVTRELLNQYNAGTLEQYGVLYANDVTVKLPSIYSEQYSERTGHFAARNLDGIWMIDGVNQFCYAVANKETAYKVVTEPVEIAENGSINLGVLVKDAPNKSVWVMIDKFRLNYLGTTLEATVEEYIPVLNEAIKKAEEFDATTTTTALATALATAIENGKAARSATTVAEVETAIAEINTALENAQAVNIIILKKTVALAQAEGIDVEAANTAIAEGITTSQIEQTLSDLRLARRVKNAETHADMFAGQAPAAGDFYLYNVGQQRFLCGGDDWGAHAAIGFPGILVTLEEADGAYKINTHLTNGDDNGNKKEYLNYGGYCDTWTNDSWQFVEQGEGKYAIARSNDNNVLLGYNNNTYNRIDTDKSDASDANNQWKLVSKADRDALIANASMENPVDVSYLIASPNFSQREDVSKWQLTNANIWERGRNHPDFAVESYNSDNCKIEQTVENLKPGIYKLSVQTFYRDGDFNKQNDILNQGGDILQLATLYAGENNTLISNVSACADMVPGVGTNSVIGFMPNGIDDACQYFQVGLYRTELTDIIVGEDGKLTFGAFKNEKQNNGDWLVLDNFRLTYLGPVEVEPELDYYVVGSMTEWGVNEQYKMTLNTEAAEGVVEYTLTKALVAGNEFKVVKSDGTTIADDAWYPGGMGNNYVIAADGEYNIYFRPNADGGDDWHEHYIFVQSNISTGINTIAADRLNGEIYNLNGQKMLKAQKGLYIINGKKAVVK